MNTIPHPFPVKPARQSGCSAARRKAEQAIYDKLHAKVQALWLCTHGMGWSYKCMEAHAWAQDDARLALARLRANL